MAGSLYLILRHLRTFAGDVKTNKCDHEWVDATNQIIQSGEVKITKIVNEEVLLAVLNPGDIFGEMALLALPFLCLAIFLVSFFTLIFKNLAKSALYTIYLLLF